MDQCFFCHRTNDDIKKLLSDIIEDKMNVDRENEIQKEKQQKTQLINENENKEKIKQLLNNIPEDLLKISVDEAKRIKQSISNKYYAELIEILEKKNIINNTFKNFGNKTIRPLKELIDQYINKNNPINKGTIKDPPLFNEYLKNISQKNYLSETTVSIKQDGSFDFDVNHALSKERQKFKVCICQICIERGKQFSENRY